MMDFYTQLDDLPRIGFSVLFIVLAIGVSRWQRAELEKDLTVATLRSFFQLILVGYALELIFRQEDPLWTLGLLLVMAVIAARVTTGRARQTPQAGVIALLSIGLGSALTIVVLVLLDVFAFTPQNIIPVGGMVIGNAMTTATLVITRLTDDLSEQRDLIETRLVLGASSRQASLPQFQRALRNALVPIVDTTKTVGLIKLPGAMTGMILAGASPLQAVQLQIIVMYMLVGATTFTALTAAYLTYSRFFTSAHQLVTLGKAR